MVDIIVCIYIYFEINIVVPFLIYISVLTWAKYFYMTDLWKRYNADVTTLDPHHF